MSCGTVRRLGTKDEDPFFFGRKSIIKKNFKYCVIIRTDKERRKGKTKSPGHWHFAWHCFDVWENKFEVDRRVDPPSIISAWESATGCGQSFGCRNGPRWSRDENASRTSDQRVSRWRVGSYVHDWRSSFVLDLIPDLILDHITSATTFRDACFHSRLNRSRRYLSLFRPLWTASMPRR